MDQKYLTEKLRELVFQNDGKGAEILLTGGDTVTWRDVIRYEHSIPEMMETALKDDRVIPQLLQFEIEGLSSFHLAAMLGHREVLTCLLKKDIPVDMPLSSGSTVLHLAAFTGHLDLVKMLLTGYKAGIHKTDSYGWTALHYASIAGHLPIAEFLVSKGIDVTARDKDGTTAAFRAKDAKHDDIVTLLVQHGDEEELLNVDDVDSDWNKKELPDYYSLPKKLNKSASSQDLETPPSSKARRPPPLPRQSSVPVSIGAHGSDADLPDEEAKTFPRPRGKQSHQEKLRKEIRRQLDIAFGSDYETPIEGSTGSVRLTKGKGAANTSSIRGIGLKTLKGMLRDEFEKFKQQAMLDKILSDISSMGEEEEEIYETLPHWNAPDIPDVPPPEEAPGAPPHYTASNKPPPPALPPRNTPKKGDDKRDSADSLTLDKQKSNAAVLNYVFKKVAPTLSSGWKKLAKELQLGNRIDAIEKKFPKDAEKQALMTLAEWRINQGNQADIDDLIIALRKCKLNDVLMKLESVCQEFTA